MDPFAESAEHFETLLQQVVFFEHYSRYDYTKGRREAWIETVDRAVAYLRELSQNKLSDEDYAFIRRMILELKAMPSMRLLAMAGDAARRNNISIFNCTYLPIDDLRAFGEIMLLSMNGCGVGYSVERDYVNRLPAVARQLEEASRDYYIVGDSTEGWVDALQYGIETWMTGYDVMFDYSLVRPAGTPLKTKGGRASGPEPLRESLNAIRAIILGRQGRKLRPIDAFDIANHILSASVSGGTRRSAGIALFDVNDQEMLESKEGAFWNVYPHRMFTNITAVIGDDTSDADLEKLLVTMDANGTGEPGIFNRDGVLRHLPKRRRPAKFGLNPCGEVLLRAMQVCNLSSVVCRPDDDLRSLREKVRAATLIGTIQAMADTFPSLRPEWAKNQREERLLGVDLIGQMDCPLVQEPWVQQQLQAHAVFYNKKYAELLGINQAAAVTTVKPGGNSAQLLNASSGLHARWSPYYIRHVRLNHKSPVRQVLLEAGYPMVPELGQSAEDATIWVVPFPVKSPDGAICRKDRTALEQLDYWLQVRTKWTEHQPSVTITYRPDELADMVIWLTQHRDLVAGLSFLPADEHAYELAPFQEISRERYEALKASLPTTVDFSRLSTIEKEDRTEASREIACSAGQCELKL